MNNPCRSQDQIARPSGHIYCRIGVTERVTSHMLHNNSYLGKIHSNQTYLPGRCEGRFTRVNHHWDLKFLGLLDQRIYPKSIISGYCIDHGMDLESLCAMVYHGFFQRCGRIFIPGIYCCETNQSVLLFQQSTQIQGRISRSSHRHIHCRSSRS